MTKTRDVDVFGKRDWVSGWRLRRAGMHPATLFNDGVLSRMHELPNENHRDIFQVEKQIKLEPL